MAKGNHEATGKKAKRGPELVQRIRAAILNAFDAAERDGKLISEVLAESFKRDPLRFMDMVSKYCPKEVAMELEANVDRNPVEMSDAELEEAILESRAALEQLDQSQRGSAEQSPRSRDERGRTKTR